MSGLVIAEVLRQWRLWIAAGITFVAAAALLATCFGLVFAVSGTTEYARLVLSGLPGTIALFGGLSAALVAQGVCALAVQAQRREHALWSLLGASPATIRLVVIAQITVLGVVAGLLGALGHVPLAHALGAQIIALTENLSPGDLAIEPSLGAVLATVGTTAAIAVLSALRPARIAAHVPPLSALRAEPPVRRRLGVLSFVVASGALAALIGTVLSVRTSSDMSSAMSGLPMLCVLMAVFLAALGPALFPAVATAWSALVSPRLGTAWHLGREGAIHRLHGATAMIGPLVAAAVLVGGMLSAFAVMGAAVEIQTGVRPRDPELAQIALMLGGPVAVAAIGAAATVVMSARVRAREQRALVLAGASRGTLVGGALGEGTVVVVTAALVALAGVALTAGLVTAALTPHAPGLAMTWAPVPALVICGAGGALVLGAIVLPVLLGRSRAALVRG